MSNQLQPTNGGGINRGSRSATGLLSRLRKARMFDQLCLLVLDGSGSMSHDLEGGLSKADATAQAASDLVNLLRKSSKSPGFSLGIVCFSDIAEIRLYAQLVDNLDTEKVNFIPFTEKGTRSRTYVKLGLQEAERMGAAFLNSSEPNSTLRREVRIILMSDGYANDADEALSVATEIKETWGDKMRIHTTLLGSTEEEYYEMAEELLINIASKDAQGVSYFIRTSSGPELRSFFEKSSTDE